MVRKWIDLERIYRNKILSENKQIEVFKEKIPKKYSYIFEEDTTSFNRILKISYKDKSLAVILSSLSTREDIVKLIKRVKFIFKK